MTPTHYTAVEGGKWLPWPSRVEFDIKNLEERQPKVVAFGVRPDGMPLNAHSLAFRNPVKNAKFPRWDCVNGWTRPIPKVA